MIQIERYEKHYKVFCNQDIEFNSSKIMEKGFMFSVNHINNYSQKYLYSIFIYNFKLAFQEEIYLPILGNFLNENILYHIVRFHSDNLKIIEHHLRVSSDVHSDQSFLNLAPIEHILHSF